MNVPPERTTHIELDLDPTAEPIEGTISVADTVQRFVGWIGLAGAIDRALGRGDPDAPHDDLDDDRRING